MDESEYRATYDKLNPTRCIFEKAITNRRCDCQQKRRFLIATREGVACKSEDRMNRCILVLDSIRNNSRFSLKVVTINGPMPHNKELKVQAGGILALQKLLQDTSDDTQHKTVMNIDKTLDEAFKQYKTLQDFPYGEIVKEIVNYVARPKRRKK